LSLAFHANEALRKPKQYGVVRDVLMCAYILKTELVGGHVGGVGRAASEVAKSFSRETSAPERFAAPRMMDRRPMPLGGTPKRVFDILGAVIALVLLAPVMILAGALVRLVIGGPVLFSQRRVGFGGKTFVCYKFRTMVLEADKVLHQHLQADPAAAQEWSQTRKLKNDPRVTCLGNVLRKSSIDELPQLFNVLRGDMSLVGPRPVLPDEMVRYGHHARAYLKARPGLTGMWQANGRSSVGYFGRVARDCYYARHWSLGLDLLLLIKTIPALMNFDNTA
jgi:exopolysaccharide production protein ExoY